MTDKEYFADTSRESNSTLSLLNVSPMYYTKQIKKIKENKKDKDPSYFIFGNAMHTYLLERDSFDDRFIVSSAKPPSNAIQRKFCNFIIASPIIDDNALKTAYKLSYATEKLKGDSILDKAKKLYDDNIEYITIEKSVGNKDIITIKQFRSIKEAEKNIKLNDAANKLLFNNSATKNLNEQIIFYDLLGIKMKSKLDRFIVDLKNKKIIILDVKTSSVQFENINFKERFKHSFEKFEYARQLLVYSLAITRYFIEHYKKYNINDFDIEFYVLAIKSNFDNEIILFKISKDTVEEQSEVLISLIEDLKYYRKNGFERRRKEVELL